ncbi:RNA polymerase sigma factor [Chryseobacterium shandongense]|uniref:Sigma-70 family RNA polymerase sigma factor n=1 Tax=Chryseobacterium shandongense TaxID=1493872 RepID=A0ABM7B9X8_9FLAO|nr:sigma-70 family RNA polymerase sigma factor [Chryseobacterium shandongense]AZA95618.1 sigma-70 family RNA polymerase sigma factor [Chryseobacterium shandongense]
MAPSLIPSEKELLLRLREDDYGAFEIIYRNHSRAIGQRLFRLLKSWDLAEDILQELFIKIWNNRGTIEPDKPLEAYMYRLTSNLVNDYFRSVSRNRRLAEELWHRISEAYNPFDDVSPVELDRELFRSIEKLPEQRKKVFLLCKVEKKSYAEVSRMLQISEAAVNDHITKANRFLKAHYNKAIPYAVVFFCQTLFGQ